MKIFVYLTVFVNLQDRLCTLFDSVVVPTYIKVEVFVDFTLHPNEDPLEYINFLQKQA